jgi:hypothetical protein
MPLSQAVIMEKARNIFNYIQKQREDMSGNFAASRGWFANLKKINNLCNIRITGEAVCANTEATIAFTSTLKDIIEYNCSMKEKDK